jgi:hypothetical protein
VGKKKVTLIAIIVIALVLVAGAFYFLVIQNPYNNRPIKAGPSSIVLTATDLPAGWTVSRSTVTGYKNFSKDVVSGLNWWAEGEYDYSSNNKTWHLGISILSWNSTGQAHDEYSWTVDDGGNIDWSSVSLGEEGCILMGSFASNDSAGRESYGASYAFRVGNVLVDATFDANGSNIYYDTAWMKGILDIQAQKVNRNNPS